MASNPTFVLREAFRKLPSEPLSVGETIIAALVLLVLGTLYCQLYCLIAFQQMNGMAMPLALSVKRSAVEAIPALAAFELSKRALDDPSHGRRLARVAAMLLVVMALTVATLSVLGPLSAGTSMPVRLLVADRLPGLTVTAAAILWAHQLRRAASRRSQPIDRQGTGAILPPPHRVDWVRAAGNYVEVHVAGRATIVRMTLRRAWAALGPDQFVQIHRSVLVNRDRIRRLDAGDRPRQLRLDDGTLLKVGRAYGARLFDQ
jgi:DNA-binding LytR/AlgR family response regulator